MFLNKYKVDRIKYPKLFLWQTKIYIYVFVLCIKEKAILYEVCLNLEYFANLIELNIQSFDLNNSVSLFNFLQI